MQYEHILKKLKFWPLTTPKSTQGPDPGDRTKFPLDIFRIYCTFVCMRNFKSRCTLASPNFRSPDLVMIFFQTGVYGDLVYFKTFVGNTKFSGPFVKIIKR